MAGNKPVETTHSEDTEYEPVNPPVEETEDQNDNGITGAAVTSLSGFGAHPLLSGLIVLILMGGLGLFIYLRNIKKNKK